MLSRETIIIFKKFIIMISIICVFLYHYQDGLISDYEETCKGSLSYLSYNTEFKMLTFLHFFKDNGVLEFKGFKNNEGKITYDFNGQILFNYKKEGNKFILSNKSTSFIHSNALFNDSATEITPLFLLNKSSHIVLERLNLVKGGAVFKISGIPIIYCNEN